MHFRKSVPAGIFLHVLLFVSVSPADEPPRYRGAMIDQSTFGEESLKVFADEWNGNLVRWQLNFDSPTSEEFFDYLAKACDKFDEMIPLLRKYGVRACLDLHSEPDGFNEDYIMRIFIDERFSNMFVDIWEYLAKRYAGEKVIWGYDLMNEPVDGIPSAGGYHIAWHDLAERAARKIREIDPEAVIIYEPANYASPLSAFNDLEPLGLPNVVYSCHEYDPLAFTHQNVMKDFTEPCVYPGEIGGEYWDKERLRQSVAHVRAFQLKYGVPIFVGEFSAVRWAPENSAYNYLKDAIEIFEEYGWDWTYHAFRESDLWSVEYPSDRNAAVPASEPTDRELLLRRYFEKNVREKQTSDDNPLSTEQ